MNFTCDCLSTIDVHRLLSRFINIFQSFSPETPGLFDQYFFNGICTYRKQGSSYNPTPPPNSLASRQFTSLLVRKSNGSLFRIIRLSNKNHSSHSLAEEKVIIAIVIGSQIYIYWSPEPIVSSMEGSGVKQPRSRVSSWLRQFSLSTKALNAAKCTKHYACIVLSTNFFSRF